MNPIERAEYDAYLRCAEKCKQKADKLAPGPAQRMAKELRLSFMSMASNVRERCGCPLCGYQYGHAIGCAKNPLDIALAKNPP